MASHPTDIRILQAINDMYLADYPAKGDPYLQVDIRALAERLGTSSELLFGRLYYDLGLRYRVSEGPRVKVALFEFEVGEEKHCVNFPYLVGTLANLRTQDRRTFWALAFSGLALLVSVVGAGREFVKDRDAVMQAEIDRMSTLAPAAATRPSNTPIRPPETLRAPAAPAMPSQ